MHIGCNYMKTVMKNLILLTLSLLLFSCNEKTENKIEETSEITTEVREIKYDNLNLQHNFPIIIEDSDWVTIPLTLEEVEEKNGMLKSSSYGRQYAYWNFIFFNSETRESHLLSDSLKMFISSYNHKSSTHNSSTRNTENEKNIFYLIATLDYNKDGKLNSEDPKYLYISDLSGKNLRQISPVNFDVINWQIMEKANIVIIQARRDNNNDKEFNNKDETVNFINNLTAKGNPKEALTKEFNIKTKQLLEQHWTKKK